MSQGQKNQYDLLSHKGPLINLSKGLGSDLRNELTSWFII